MNAASSAAADLSRSCAHLLQQRELKDRSRPSLAREFSPQFSGGEQDGATPHFALSALTEKHARKLAGSSQ